MTLKEQQTKLDNELMELLRLIKLHGQDSPDDKFWDSQLKEYGTEEKMFKHVSNFLPVLSVSGSYEINLDGCKITLKDLSLQSIWRLKEQTKVLTQKEREKSLNPQLHYVLETFQTMNEYDEAVKDNLENIEQAKLDNNKKLVAIFELRQKQLEAYPKHDIQHREKFAEAKTSPFIQKLLKSSEYAKYDKEYKAIQDFALLKKFGYEKESIVNFKALELAEHCLEYEISIEDYEKETEIKLAEAKEQIQEFYRRDGRLRRFNSRSKDWRYTYLSRTIEDCQNILFKIINNKQDVEKLFNQFYKVAV